MSDLDKLLELDEACQLVFDGKFEAATLTAAFKRGELGMLKMGRKYFVTRRLLNEWTAKCLRYQNRPVSGSDRPEASAERRGSSSTGGSKSPLDALLTTANALSEHWQSTSAKSTGRKGRAIRAVSP